ncbi:MAG TPA: tetratricopeptide repeat protein, partial [Bacteroidetes bacterium]|nr:tetratricopeptide repeat protein [Bacteroidota bacterium]
VFKRLFDHATEGIDEVGAGPHRWGNIIAFFTTLLFGLHTANAETINYIGGRTDSFSTLCVVASLLLYMTPWARKRYLHFITIVIGLFAKQTGLMIIPILFIYILYFEEDLSLKDIANWSGVSKVQALIVRLLPIIILGVSLFLWLHFAMTPPKASPTNQGVEKLAYISTQCFVILNYIGNFILPTDLCVDHDIDIIRPIYDKRILMGFMLILALFYIAYKTSIKKRNRPISFGILWFFFALAPTTFVPLFQVSNDHRMFFAFVGLALSLGWYVGLKFIEYEALLKRNSFIRGISLIAVVITLSGFAYGTRERNKVWNSSETLWYDAAIKSPNNGRALMNYGLTQMEKGNYDEAMKYYKLALVKWPNFPSLHVNLGIMYGIKKQHDKANQHFKKAIRVKPNDPYSYYYYARYLKERKQFDEAYFNLKKALSLSPNYTNAKALMESLKWAKTSISEKVKHLKRQVDETPTESNCIELSLLLYDSGRHKENVEVCKKLISLNDGSFQAYNNMCASYNSLGMWEEGIKAGKEALKIDPKSQLAKNNLNWSYTIKEKSN